jgi:hypothetical protein
MGRRWGCPRPTWRRTRRSRDRQLVLRLSILLLPVLRRRLLSILRLRVRLLARSPVAPRQTTRGSAYPRADDDNLNSMKADSAGATRAERKWG